MPESLASLQRAYYRFVQDPLTEACGFVVIDELICGRGSGGLRCTASVTIDKDVSLAREVTLTLAFPNLPSGGAKAGRTIRHGMPEDKRMLACLNFGAGIADLIQSKKHVSGLDLGTTAGGIDSYSHRDALATLFAPEFSGPAENGAGTE